MTYRITYFLRSGAYHSQEYIEATDRADAQRRASEHICGMRPQGVDISRFEIKEDES